MEVMYAEKMFRSELLDKKINGIYGDVIDLVNMQIDIRGVDYDDNWKVSRFLSSIFKHKKDRINSIINYLDLNENILNIKIKELSTYEFKLILLAYLLVNNKNILIFDYFEVGLNYKEQKKLINIFRKLKNDGKTIIIISNNFVFMNNIIDNFILIENGQVQYTGKLVDAFSCEKNNLIEPKIIKFIKMANKRNAKLDLTLDSKELLKDIYRSVY